MRTKNGNRIGPVPIAAVAVFALAALLSAGLLVLIPGSTQAQSATNRLPDVTLDVGESHAVITAMVLTVTADPNGDVVGSAGAFPVEARNFTIESDQDDPLDDSEEVQNLIDDNDTNGAIETELGTNRSDAIRINSTTGAIEIPVTIATQPNAEQADNTARITVKADDENNEALTPVRFNLTIVQNPFERNGIEVNNPAEWPATGDCAVQSTTGIALLSRTVGNNPITLSNGAVLVDGGECTTAGDSIEVALRNTGANANEREITYLAYVTGGSDFSKVDGYPGKSGLTQVVHKLSEIDDLGDPGEGAIDVTRSMADKNNQVFVYGYLGDLAAKRLRANSEAFEADADFVVRVQFVDGPALAFDANRDDKSFNAADDTDGDVDGSTLVSDATAVDTDQDQDKDGYFDGMYMIPSGSDAEIGITATIKDANGNRLNAGDKDSRVDFSVMYVAGSDISDSAANYNSRRVIKKGMNTASVMVGGWNDSNKAVRVTVSATYTSPSAPDGFDLGTVTLIRVAEFASSADFSTYICNKAKDTEKAAEKGCMVGYEAKEDMRVGREDYFVVHGQFEDALGSKTQDSPELDLSDDAEEAFDLSLTSATGYSARARDGSVLVQVKEEAEFGEYTITVTNGESGDNEVTQDLTFFVAGPIDSYMVEGPENEVIELDSSAMFTVTAMDENGGVPDFGTTTATDNLVEVAVQPVTTLVTGLEPDGQLKLDEDTGMGTFIVYSALNASRGDRGRVIIGSGAMQQIVNISFGGNRAPMAGADIDPVMMTVGDDPMMVATMFTDANMDDMLSYTEMSSDEMVATAMVDMDGMVTITAVGAGEATITVTATDMDGAYAMQTIMVTVEYANVAPMAGADIDPVMMTVGDDPMMVATMFTDANMDDMLSYTEMSSDEMVATAMVDMDGMVTITAVGAGEATITVTATDMDGESAMQTIMVTVMMATTMMDELGTVTDVTANSFPGGALQVSWTKAANASGYIIIAVNVNDVNGDVVAVPLNDGDLDTWNIPGLTPRATYDIYVAATASGGRNTLSDAARVTAK